MKVGDIPPETTCTIITRRQRPSYAGIQTDEHYPILWSLQRSRSRCRLSSRGVQCVRAGTGVVLSPRVVPQKWHEMGPGIPGLTRTSLAFQDLRQRPSLRHASNPPHGIEAKQMHENVSFCTIPLIRGSGLMQISAVSQLNCSPRTALLRGALPGSAAQCSAAAAQRGQWRPLSA